MFKRIILGTLLLISASTFAQNTIPAAKDETTSKIIGKLTLAGLLVNYGYETETALPLIQAVKIYQELNLQPAMDDLKPVVEGEGEKEETVAKRPARTQEQLLADATQFAKGEPALLSLINDCQKTSRKPTETYFFRNDYIAPNKTHVWEVPLSGGEHSFVHLSGDGSSDLDLYLYDLEDNEIDKDTSAGDQCGLTVFEKLSTIVVKIVNRGSVPNNYSLTVY